MNPPDRPTATQLPIQNCRRKPGSNRIWRKPEPVEVRLWRDSPDVVAQGRQRLGLARVGAGIHVANTTPGLQTDIPYPAGRHCRRAGHRGDGLARIRIRDLHRDRRVVEQDLLHRHECGLRVAADKESPLARAIHEQVAGQPLPRRQHDGSNAAVGRGLDSLNIAGDVLDTEPGDRMLMQQARELAGVEVIAVVDVECVFGSRGLLRRQPGRDDRCLRRHEIGKGARAFRGQPVLGQVQRRVLRRQAEGVHILGIVTLPGPAGEPRTLLETRLAVADEFSLGQADLLQRQAHRRPGSLADADDRNVRRFDEDDLGRMGRLAVLGSDQAGSDPPGRTASDDNDLAYRVLHRLSLP